MKFNKTKFLFSIAVKTGCREVTFEKQRRRREKIDRKMG
jgi:hypothetical protein